MVYIADTKGMNQAGLLGFLLTDVIESGNVLLVCKLHFDNRCNRFCQDAFWNQTALPDS